MSLRNSQLVNRLLVCLTLGLALTACGEEIGDSCSLSTDCSSSGTRICDTTSPGGYCTVIGCDVGTCPQESVCVRFFPVTESNRTCDPALEDVSENYCTADEVCTIQQVCSPRNSEVRFCMRTCGSDGDCRSEYDCRDQAGSEMYGGEPVPEAGEATGSNTERFCAASPPTRQL
jgi:hypothetical protein